MPDATNWDGLAKRYDRIVRLFDRSYLAIRRRLADDFRGTENVLEVAAGTGQFSFDLARVAKAVVATDYSSGMVERIRLRALEQRVKNLEVRQMNAHALDYPDSCFDGVFCANGLHVMDRPEVALREMRRVLCDDGVLVVPTFLHGSGRIQRTLSRALSAVSSFVAHTRFSLGGLVLVVAEAGFEVVSAVSLPGIFPVGYVVARKQ